MTQAVALKNRGLLAITGDERKTFLQGLITNDISLLTQEQPLYAAFLTPQGKYLFDFIIIEKDETVYLDCELERAPDLWKRLMMFKLRAKADIVDISNDSRIWTVWGDDSINYPSYPDPRHWKLGRRAIVPKGVNLTLPDDGSEGLMPLKFEDYEVERITLGVTDASRDCLVDKYFWLECRAEDLNGVSFTKGCYIGQEQTTRMKHRTTIKKSLLPIKLSHKAESGDTVVNKEGKVAGEIHSVARDVAMAYLRLKFLDEDLFCNEAPINLI